jgi:hypothetical protein
LQLQLNVVLANFFVFLLVAVAVFPTTTSAVTVQAAIWILQAQPAAFGCGL